MSVFYSLPLTTEVDADSPLNESLFSTRIRGTLLALGPANSVFGSFAGSGVDGVGPSITGNLDCGTGKQYTSWSVGAGVTITFTTSSGIHLIGVTGTFTLDGTLIASGTGAAGGADPGDVAADGSHSSTAWPGCNDSATGGGGGGHYCNLGGDHYRGGGSFSGGRMTPGGYMVWLQRYDSIYPSKTGTAGYAASSTSVARWYEDPCRLGLPGGGGGGGHYGPRGTLSGDGSAGGGLTIVECDTFVFNSGAFIYANGTNGVNSTSYGSGGGGGGGGTVLVIARTVSTNAGTIQANGGSGGTATESANDTCGAGGAGGAGRYAVVTLGA